MPRAFLGLMTKAAAPEPQDPAGHGATDEPYYTSRLHIPRALAEGSSCPRPVRGRLRVLVVGGGPAGAVAAWSAARLGAEVTLVERSGPDRDKLCSGVLAWHTLRLLHALGLTPAGVLGEVRETVYRTPLGSGSVRHRPYLFVDRVAFDYHLRQEAKAAGARVLHGVQVTEVEVRQRVAKTTCQELSFDALILADGCPSRFARLLAPDPPHAVAFEARVEDAAAPRAFVDWTLPGGYRWEFRTGRRRAVGLGTALLGASSREAALTWAREQGIVSAPPGHLIPLAPRTVVAGPGVFAVGDAAGLVDPLLGEGIPHALLTGWWAGQAAVRQDAHAYALRVARLVRRLSPSRWVGQFVARGQAKEITRFLHFVPPRLAAWWFLEAALTRRLR